MQVHARGPDMSARQSPCIKTADSGRSTEWACSGHLVTPKSRQRRARFPHSHSFDDEGGWKSGKPKAGFPLSHRLGFLFPKTKTQAAVGLSPAPLPPTTSTNSGTFPFTPTLGVLIVSQYRPPQLAPF